MGTVHVLPVETTLDIPVERVLEGAKHLERVIVIGTDRDGEPYYASSLSSKGEHLLMVERFKAFLISEAK